MTKPIERETLLDQVSTLLRRQADSDDVQEYFATVSKIVLLEGDPSLNGNQDAYKRLVERRRQLTGELAQTLEGFDQRDFVAQYHQLSSSGTSG